MSMYTPPNDPGNTGDQPVDPTVSGTTAANPKTPTMRNFLIHAAIFAVANLVLGFVGNSWIAGVISGEWSFQTFVTGVDTVNGAPAPFLVNSTRIWLIVLVIDLIYSLYKVGLSGSRTVPRP